MSFGFGFGLPSWKTAVAAVTDAYFKYVSLLLNTTSTNGAQNNTFLDSSANAFSVTRNGNTTQGTFSPFSQTGWSNYFDGASDLRIASNAAFAPGTGDFTFEMWINPSSWAAVAPIFVVVGTGGLWIGKNSSNFVVRAYGVADQLQYATMPSTNTWTHIVAVRSGTTLSLYFNGSRVATATNSYNFAQAAVGIGSDRDAVTPSYYTGYVSNLRLVKGTAVYDPTQTTITVPTAPLTAITNTSVLTCQSNRFIDNSSNAFAITRNGDVRVEAFSPFSPTAAWSASTNGGSGYFDGTGDYLAAPDNAAFEFGNGDYTAEAWVYLTGYSANYVGSFAGAIFAKNSGNADLGFYLLVNGTASSWTGVTVTQYYSGATNESTTATSALLLNTWYHVAATRSGGSVRIFINGVQANTTATFTQTQNNTTASFTIGGQLFSSYTYSLPGYISNARVVKGTAVYTANFTPPTSPLTAISGTSLLLNFTNAGIYDSASGNDLETVGNAQVSTTQAKWGTTSMAFDGTGDYVVAPSTVRYGYGTGDFTIEFWLYLNTAAADQTLVSNLTSVSSTNPHIYLNGATGTIRYYTASADRITGSALSAGQWYHIAVSRASSNTRMFINGTQTGSTYADANNYGATAPIGVGTYWSAGSPVGTSTLNGYIDDLRITNGVARYTGNFTPPTAAFPLN